MLSHSFRFPSVAKMGVVVGKRGRLQFRSSEVSLPVTPTTRQFPRLYIPKKISFFRFEGKMHPSQRKI